MFIKWLFHSLVYCERLVMAMTMNFLDNKNRPMRGSAQQYTNLIVWRYMWTVCFHTFPPRSCTVQSDSKIMCKASELRIRKRLLHAVINNSVSNGLVQLFHNRLPQNAHSHHMGHFLVVLKSKYCGLEKVTWVQQTLLCTLARSFSFRYVIAFVISSSLASSK